MGRRSSVASRQPATPTLGQALERAAGFPGTGLRFLDRRERERFLSWTELRKRARRVAAGLRALGVQPHDRVALIHPTGPEFFDGFFGTLLAGAVPVPLYPPVRLGRLAEYHLRTARMLRAASAQVVLADRRVRRLLGATLERARPRLGCLTIREVGEVAKDGPAVPEAARAVSPEDLALVQFSSGTTVAPKPVALSHRAVMAQVRILNSFWPDSEEMRHAGVSWLPLYHDMGLIGCVFPALERPAVLTLIGPEVFVARPAVWLRAMSRYRATISPAPNFAYGLCVEKIRDDEMEGVDLSSWAVALNGAEAVAPSVLRAFQERFSRWGLSPTTLTPVYGLSEAALAVTFSPLDEPFVTTRFDREALATEGRARPTADGIELVSVGRPLPGFELAVRPPEGGPGDPPLPEDRVGRLWVRGPSLMAGYLDQPEATDRTLVDGWLDTGDLGFLHRGRLYLTGRAKDVVILRGRNYPPDEIEHALDRVAGVRTGCGVATSWLPEDGDREELFVFVEHAKDASDAEREKIPEDCRKAVAAATGLDPDHVVVLAPGTLPRTSSGKLRRRRTLELYLAGELTPPEPVTALRMAGALARSGLAHARLRWGGAPVREGDEG
jgi:fatty-acyl-CoA synthase